MSTKYARSDFFAYLSPTVIKVKQEGSPMFPSVRLAQNWLETGGKIHDWNNLGGIKASGSTNQYWKGASVNTATWEVYNGVTVNTSANWRVYASIYDFYKDQDLLFAKSRYIRVCQSKTPEEQCNALYLCGYATDPNYASKLMSIIKTNNLVKYDLEVEEGMTTEEKKAFDELKVTVKEQTELIASLTNSKDYMKTWLTKVDNRVANIEKSEKTTAPKWFIDEFGSADLGGIINNPVGDTTFWRNIAISVRLMNK